MSRSTHLENVGFIVALLVLLFTPLLPAGLSLAASGLVLVGIVALLAVRRTQRTRRAVDRR